jgi:hypothetical protein
MRLWSKPVAGSPHPGPERRTRDRRRTRLRPGKLLDGDMRFLADCAIVDRSGDGLRVRCFGGIDGHETLVVFDAKDGSLQNGRVAWLRPPEAGIRLVGAPAAADADALRRLAGPYYAVAD